MEFAPSRTVRASFGAYGSPFLLSFRLKVFYRREGNKLRDAIWEPITVTQTILMEFLNHAINVLANTNVAFVSAGLITPLNKIA